MTLMIFASGIVTTITFSCLLLATSNLAQADQQRVLNPEVGLVKRVGTDLELVLSTERASNVASIMKVPGRHTVVTSGFYFAQDPSRPDGVATYSWTLLKNIYGQMQAIGLGANLINVCATYQQCVLAWKAGFPVFLTPRIYHGDKEPYPERLRSLMTKLKFLVAYSFLTAGFDVIHTDWDIGINDKSVHTFWDYIDSTPHDWMGLRDSRVGNFEARASQLPELAWECDTQYSIKPNFCHSTGFLHAKASQNSADFALDVWTQSSKEQAWEQAKYNELAPYWALPMPYNATWTPLVFRSFPTPQISNFVLLHTLQNVDVSEVHLLHCGWHSSLEKVGCLERGYGGRPYLRSATTEAVAMHPALEELRPVSSMSQL